MYLGEQTIILALNGCRRWTIKDQRTLSKVVTYLNGLDIFIFLNKFSDTDFAKSIYDEIEKVKNKNCIILV